MKLRNTKVKIWFCTHYLHKILTWLYFISAEDEAAAARISAKNGLESYAYNLRNSLNDQKLADKFETGDKTRLEGAVNETIKWLDVSQEGSKEEYEDKQKELESIAKYVFVLVLLAS
jgi:molecular chaperone DnaK (HSP70)